MSLEAVVKSYLAAPAIRADEELECFRSQKSLREAISLAARACNCEGKRFSHQYRIKKVALETAEKILLRLERAIRDAKTFDELFRIVKAGCHSVIGLGPLYVYDTTLRISSFRRILPEQVYLHAGTRVGARALGLDHKQEALPKSVFPKVLRALSAYQIEDILCIYKDRLIASSGVGETRNWHRKGGCAPGGHLTRACT